MPNKALFQLLISARHSSLGTVLFATSVGERLFMAAFRRTKPLRGIVSLNFMGARMFVAIDDKVGPGGDLLLGEYESRELAYFLSFVTKDTIVADVGANIGIYSVLAAKKAKMVYAFEPEPLNCSILRKNILVNRLSNVSTIQKGVLDSKKTLRLYLDKNNKGAHSMMKENVWREAGSVEIETTDLDSFFEQKEPPNILKIDVQGAEFRVINGAKKLLERSVVIVFMEIWPYGLMQAGTTPNEIFTFMGSFGFNGFNIASYKVESGKKSVKDMYLNYAFLKQKG